MDVAPSNSSEDGHTVAYVIDIAERTTCAGPLDEHAVEFEVATVKEALALLQAGPSAERSPPDPTEAEPGSESADFQMAAEDGVFATSAQRADAFLNGMAAQEARPQPAQNSALATPVQGADVALDRMAEPLAASKAQEPSQREPPQPPTGPPMPLPPMPPLPGPPMPPPGPLAAEGCEECHCEPTAVAIERDALKLVETASAKRLREADEATERAEQLTRQQVRRTEIESQRSARAEASIAGSDLPGAAVRGVVRSEREDPPKCNVDTYDEVGWFRPPKISKDMSTEKPIKRTYFQPRRRGEEIF